MTERSYARRYLDALLATVSRLDDGAIMQAVEWLRDCAEQQRTIFGCGNGGSATIVSHMAGEMVKQASIGRRPRLKMISLADNVCTMLSYANDVDFDSIFAEPLANFAQPGDVLIAVSGSGTSRNVLRAVEMAHQLGCKTIGLTTAEGGRLKDLVQLPLLVPGKHQGRLEDGFSTIMHILCYTFIDRAV